MFKIRLQKAWNYTKWHQPVLQYVYNERRSWTKKLIIAHRFVYSFFISQIQVNTFPKTVDSMTQPIYWLALAIAVTVSYVVQAILIGIPLYLIKKKWIQYEEKLYIALLIFLLIMDGVMNYIAWGLGYDDPNSKYAQNIQFSLYTAIFKDFVLYFILVLIRKKENKSIAEEKDELKKLNKIQDDLEEVEKQ